ncbi:MAG: hypothetical protein NZ839_01515, partial [Endomicrobia bacterium]|nr:hypothetical protein [Endomicrobiia bacterium]
MRQIVVFLFIFGFLYLYPNTKESNIIGLLESGNFGEVEKIILFSKDEEYKNFLISLLHLYKGDYETAESYIVKISSIWYDRNDYLPSSEKKFFISYIFGIKSLLSNYTVIESEHFKIWLKGRDIILKDLVIQKLEEIYNFYNKIFGYNILEKIRVEIYNTKEEFYFASTLGKEVVDKTGVVGICKFNKIMILSPENLPLGYRWCDTLSHEYLHLLLNRLTEFTYPLYLHEGTARYFDTLYRSSEPLCFTPGNLKLLLEAKNNNKLISFKDMRGSLAYLETQQQVELAFTELATFVEYLIMNFGIDRFIHFIRKYKEYNTQEIKLYKYVFGKDFDDIISEWLKYIDTKFEVVKNYPGAQPDIKI